MRFEAIARAAFRGTLIVLAVSAALGLTAMGAETQPATSPATSTGPAPAPAPVVKPMDRSYHVLLDFSIFSRDHKPAPVAVPSTRPAEAPVVLGEASYILRGVGMADGRPTAFFELTSDQRITTIHLGEPVLHGIVTAGSLDGVDYVVDGKASHIRIGQSLDGGMPLESSTAPSDGATTATKKWARSHHAD